MISVFLLQISALFPYGSPLPRFLVCASMVETARAYVNFVEVSSFHSDIGLQFCLCFVFLWTGRGVCYVLVGLSFEKLFIVSLLMGILRSLCSCLSYLTFEISIGSRSRYSCLLVFFFLSLESRTLIFEVKMETRSWKALHCLESYCLERGIPVI